MSDLVPDGWSSTTLSDLVVLQYGKSPKGVMLDGGKYPIIGTGGVTGYASDYLHDGHTTVIGRKGTINRPSFILNKFWAIDTTYIATDYKEADPKWFYYGLNNIDLTKYNEASGVPSLNRDTLYAIPFKRPPLPEQQKIAAILSSVDEVIEKTQAQINKLKDLKTGMMQELLSPREGQATNINITQGESKNSLHHTEFKDSPLGRIPVGWEVKSLSELVKPDSPICYGILMPGRGVAIGTPVIKVKDIKDNQIKEKGLLLTSKEIDEKYARSRVKFGDILVTIRGTTGRLAIVPASLDGANITQDTARLRIEKSELSKYVFTYLQGPSAQKKIEYNTIGQAVKGINLAEVRKLNIALPPEEERNRLTDSITSLDNRLNLIFGKMQNLMNIKKALMQDLLTGKVRVKVDAA
jgi:type I restriction enzyme S subunit